MRQELAALGNGAHALAIQIVGNADDAADAVHDALLAALDKPGAYNASRGPLKPWFMRVVRNRCIDLIRRRRPEAVPVDTLVDDTAGPDQEAEAAEQDRILKRSLHALAPEQRQIIVLRDYLDLSYAEIAAVLDIAAGTVMSRLHRARLAPREKFKRHHD
jgi:RNA polymerase sigma-70 factor (ECF subfamily)